MYTTHFQPTEYDFIITLTANEVLGHIFTLFNATPIGFEQKYFSTELLTGFFTRALCFDLP